MVQLYSFIVIVSKKKGGIYEMNKRKTLTVAFSINEPLIKGDTSKQNAPKFPPERSFVIFHLLLIIPYFIRPAVSSDTPTVVEYPPHHTL
jgi:hypothetical protein